MEVKILCIKIRRCFLHQTVQTRRRPLLFLDGHRIPITPKIKFLGLILDSKLLWKDHTQMVANKCIRLKNAFSIITKSTYASSIKILCTIYKSLVRSRIDYGLPIYGSACNSNLLKIDVASRSILRLILGSKSSTPKEVLYAETGTEPLADRRSWLSTRYLINLIHHPGNLTYQTTKNLFFSSEQWSPRCSPSLMLSCEKKNRLAQRYLANNSHSLFLIII